MFFSNNEIQRQTREAQEERYKRRYPNVEKIKACIGRLQHEERRQKRQKTEDFVGSPTGTTGGSGHLYDENKVSGNDCDSDVDSVGAESSDGESSPGRNVGSLPDEEVQSAEPVVYTGSDASTQEVPSSFSEPYNGESWVSIFKRLSEHPFRPYLAHDIVRYHDAEERDHLVEQFNKRVKISSMYANTKYRPPFFVYRPRHSRIQAYTLHPRLSMELPEMLVRKV